MTLETVVPDRLNNVAVFVTDAPAKSVATFCPLSKGLSFNTITTECKQTEEHSVLPIRILYLNFMFPLFVHPLYQLKTKHGKSLGKKRNIIGELCPLSIEFSYYMQV
jgi:hypothetical protein